MVMRLRWERLLVLVVLSATGCASDHSRFEYVLRKGEPDRIRRWALLQTSRPKIDDAHYALYHIATMDEDQRRADAAVHELIRLHMWMRTGWPGLRPRVDANTRSTQNDETLEYLTRDYKAFAWRASRGDMRFREAFEEIEPLPEHSELLTEWRLQERKYGL